MPLQMPEVPEAARKTRQIQVDSWGPHILLESFPDAWYHGGTEVVITSLPTGGVWMEVHDLEEGSIQSASLTIEQVAKLVELSTMGQAK